MINKRNTIKMKTIVDFGTFMGESRIYTPLELERKSRELLRDLGISNPSSEQLEVIVDAIRQVVKK
jgi:hypothetical protein